MNPNDLDSLYSNTILDHCRSPRNHEELDNPDISGTAVNPFCGDEVVLQIELDGERVSKVGIQGVGCSINRASSSMLSEAVFNKSLDDIGTISNLFRDMITGTISSKQETEKLKDLKLIANVAEYPARMKCALLAWSALEEAIDDYHKRSNT